VVEVVEGVDVLAVLGVVVLGAAEVVVEEEAAADDVADGLGLLWTARPTTPATSRAAMPPPTTSTGAAAPWALPPSRTTHPFLVDGKAPSDDADRDLGPQPGAPANWSG